MSVELMNSVAEEMVLNNEKIQKVFNGDRYSEEKEKDVLYNTNISEKNIKVFLDIKRLCDKNNVEFLALKVQLYIGRILIVHLGQKKNIIK